MKVKSGFWMKAYSPDLRERIIKARQEGAGAAETAKRYGVCKRTVERYWKRVNETGQCGELRRGGRRVSRLKPHLETLRGWIEAQNDLTLAEMLGRLRGELGVCIKRQALWHQLNRLGLTYKKNAARRRAGSGRRKGSPATLAGKPAVLAGRKAGVHR
ncbi:transposase [Opitutaceae bacterium TAV1]|nr:transposase [Opitutaceae bacterium TAV1]